MNSRFSLAPLAVDTATHAVFLHITPAAYAARRSLPTPETRYGFVSRTAITSQSYSHMHTGPLRATLGTEKRTANAADYGSLAKSAAWSMAQSWNERAAAPVTSNTVDVTTAGRPTAAA